MPSQLHTRLAVPLAVVAAWAVPPAADASLYCVNKPPCEGGIALPAGRLQDALDAAASTTTPDTVEVGPHDTTYEGPFVYAGASPLALTGTSPTRTVLAGPPGSTVLDLSGPATTVTDLGIDPGDGAGARGLVLAGRAKRIAIRQRSGREFEGTPAGLLLLQDARFEDGSVVMRRGDAAVSQAPGGTRAVVDSTLSTAAGGAGVRATAPLTVTRTLITSAEIGVLASGPDAAVRLESDLVRTGTGGLWSSSGARLDGDHVTLVKEKPGDEVGVKALHTGPGPATAITLTSSIVSGYENGTGRFSAAAGSASLHVRYSSLSGTNTASGPGATDLATGNRVGTRDDFAAPDPIGPFGLRDYRLAPGSGAIDAAAPDAPAALDLLRHARTADGDGDGQARPDMGAYEQPGITPAEPSGPGAPSAPGDPALPAVPATQPAPPATPNRPQPSAPAWDGFPARAGLARAIAGRRALRAARKGSVIVRVACPEGSAPCRGRVVLKHGKRTLASRAFTVAAGRRTRLRLKLRPAARRLVRARGAGRLRVAIRS